MRDTDTDSHRREGRRKLVVTSAPQEERGTQMRSEQTVYELARLVMTGDLSEWSEIALDRLIATFQPHIADRTVAIAAQIARNARDRKRGMLPPPWNAGAGFIYLIQAEDGPVKIGKARDLVQRAAQVITQLPFRAEVIHNIATDNMRWAERTLHDRFAAQRLNGEWFKLHKRDLDWLRALDRLDEGDRV